MRTVVIAGTGLIGASFGLALKRKAGFTGEVIGVSNPDAIAAAQASGAIDRALPLKEACALADLLFIAQPISRIVDTIGRVDQWLPPGALVTDAGSTKAAIVDAAATSIKRAQFLGGHPMAGKATTGAEQATERLFEGRTYILTPGNLATPEARWLLGVIEAIGSNVLLMSPAEHDRVVAWTSHLPQLAATALAATAGQHLESPEQYRAAGPGLIDTTRLADSPYEIWKDILETNPANIGAALDAYVAKLIALRKQLPAVDAEFASGADFRRELKAAVKAAR